MDLLGGKLGPILLQLPPHWRCDPHRLEAFLAIPGVVDTDAVVREGEVRDVRAAARHVTREAAVRLRGRRAVRGVLPAVAAAVAAGCSRVMVPEGNATEARLRRIFRVDRPPLWSPQVRASLRKECVVIGSMNRIEIWDPTAWETYSEEQEQKFSELSDEVFPGI